MFTQMLFMFTYVDPFMFTYVNAFHVYLEMLFMFIHFQAFQLVKILSNSITMLATSEH